MKGTVTCQTIMFQLALLMLFAWTTGIANKHVELCRWKREKFICVKCPTNVLKKVELPIESCVLSSCEKCAVQLTSRILTPDMQLVEPKQFWLSTSFQPNGTSSACQCLRNSKPCKCLHPDYCFGNSVFCSMYPCSNVSSCYCIFAKAETNIIHYDSTGQIVNPDILNYYECVYRKTSSAHLEVLRHKRSRRVLAAAELTQDNEQDGLTDTWLHKDIKIQFHDPIFTISTGGVMVLRKNGLQTIETFNASSQIAIPPPLAIHQGTLDFVFISKHGEHIRGSVEIQGSLICTESDCFWCTKFISRIHCLPRLIQCVLYSIVAIVGTVALYYLKTAGLLIISTVRAVWWISYQSFRLGKAVTKVCLIKGASIGNKSRLIVRSVNDHLDRQVNVPLSPALLALICLILIVNVQGKCTENFVVSSKNFHCVQHHHIEECTIKENLQLTLRNLNFKACLWLTQEGTDKTIQLEITLVKAVSKWYTELKYFTLKTQWKMLSTFICNFHEKCSYLSHCKMEKQFFPDIPKDIQMLPGHNLCYPVGSANSRCVLFTFDSCLFARITVIPDYEYQYEVRKITSNVVHYDLQVSINGNASQIITLNEGRFVAENIFIQVLGSLDQPSIQLDQHLIVRTSNMNEAYLDVVSPANRPREGMVGNIQSNTTFPTDFLYLKSEFKCQTFQQELECSRATPYLDHMISTKDTALPKVSGFHRFYINANGRLESELLATQPVLVGIQFSNYKLTIMTQKICPHLGTKDIMVTGYFPTKSLAELQLEVYSTCGTGVATVSFETIQIATRTIPVGPDKTVQIIQFHSDTACGKDKICIAASGVRVCRQFNFCLETGQLLSAQPNLTYWTSSHLQSLQQGDWSFSSLVQGLFGWTHSFKYIIVIMMAALSCTFIISCCLNMCRR